MTVENNRNQTRLIMLMNKQNHRKRIQKQHKINLLMQSPTNEVYFIFVKIK